MAIIRKLQTARGSSVGVSSTTEASLATYAFAAGTLTPGKIYELNGGMVTIDTNVGDNLAIAVRFGTSDTVASNTGCGTDTVATAADGELCCVLIKLHVQTATRAVANVWLAAADAAGVAPVYSFTTVLTIAQATAYRMDWTAVYDASHADNECAAESWSVIEQA